jgi:ATPase family AAA domain-containing protein 2
MGQQYLGAAILHHLEKTHVQSFDLATLMGDSARTPESALVQLFVEVKRHKPSVIYIPNMDLWFRTISEAARETFITLIRGITPSDPILLLGLVESSLSQVDPDLRSMFGYSLQNRVEVGSPPHVLLLAFDSNGIGISLHVFQERSVQPGQGTL